MFKEKKLDLFRRATLSTREPKASSSLGRPPCPRILRTGCEPVTRFLGGVHYWKGSLGKTLKYELPHKLFSCVPSGSVYLPGPELLTNRANQLSFIRNKRGFKKIGQVRDNYQRTGQENLSSVSGLWKPISKFWVQCATQIFLSRTRISAGSVAPRSELPMTSRAYESPEDLIKMQVCI